MHRHHKPPRAARRHSDGWAGAGWVARWLLVLLVAFDVVSAPFHHHHHDGVQTLPGTTAAHALFDDGDGHADVLADVHADVHADESDPAPASHSAMAIRVDPSRAAHLPGIDQTQAKVALSAVAQGLQALDEPPPTHWRPDRSPPAFRSYRSLPPAGRASPLHT